MARSDPHLLTFRLSCWLLAITGFAQIVTAGIALAMRIELARTAPIHTPIAATNPVVAINQPRPKVPAPQVQEATALASQAAKMIPTAPTPSSIVETAPLPPARPITAPSVADPVTEKLLKEAKTARLAEDMVTAITKLEQALQQSPRQAQVLFELGLCHEDMGIYDRARQYYHQVFQLGTTAAGNLYLQAAEKLKAGFEQPQDKIHRLVLGRIRLFRDSRHKDGEKVIITIPIQCPPGEKIECRDLEVRVNFFDEIGAKKEVQPADTSVAQVDSRWTTDPLDWATGEELLQVTYTIPPDDIQQSHLFGQRKYHGQVVELAYRGQLIDAQAWPRVLAHKLNQPDSSPMLLEGEMPPDFNSENPLLPNANESGMAPANHLSLEEVTPLPLPEEDHQETQPQ